jgi:hypothetical protein
MLSHSGYINSYHNSYRLDVASSPYLPQPKDFQWRDLGKKLAEYPRIAKKSTHAIPSQYEESIGTKKSLVRSLHKLENTIRHSYSSWHEDTLKSLHDALRFLDILPENDSGGYISVSDDDPEVILRWYNGRQWVNVHFDGSGYYEYAYMKDDSFVNGKATGDLTKFTMPDDLETYLKSLFDDAL